MSRLDPKVWVKVTALRESKDFSFPEPPVNVFYNILSHGK